MPHDPSPPRDDGGLRLRERSASGRLSAIFFGVRSLVSKLMDSLRTILSGGGGRGGGPW